MTLLILVLGGVPCAHAAQEVYAAEVVPASQTSERLSLELQDVSVFDVFKILSKKSGLNIVAGKNVQGQVSIFLQDVSVTEALKTILKSQRLASVEEDGIIRVITEDEYLRKYARPYGDDRLTKVFNLLHASAESVAAKLQDRKTDHGKIITEPRTNKIIITELPRILDEMAALIHESDQPQESEVFRLDYTDVEELAPKIKAFMEKSGGTFEIDKRSNRLVVFDIASRVEKIRALVEAFDVKTRQVLIDAKIVEVQLTDAYRKGIDWQAIFNEVGNIDTISALAPLTVSPPTGVSALSTLTLGSSPNNLQAIISLLERVGKTNLLSSPRLTVMNNEEATLAVATREPFVSQTIIQTTNSTNTADTVEFVDVGVTLKVQPQISHDRFVELKIKPEVSSSSQSLELEGVAQGSNTTFTRTRIPIVTTQELETTVLIKSGHTIIIGGLIQDKQSKVSSRVPILADLPLIGSAFESRTDDFTKTELVVFLTPNIIDPDETTREKDRFMTSAGDIKTFESFGEYATPLGDGPLVFNEDAFWEGRKSTPAEQADGST